MKNLKVLISTLLMLALVAVAGNALANVAANTQIINQASLSYDDGTGTKTSTTQVVVTVSLVPAAPVIIPGPDQETSYNGSGTTLHNSFYVRASANGPDTYNLSTAISGSTNTTGPTATITSGATIYLGATVTFDTSSTTTSIVVPADGTADNEVNGIEAGDTVVIDGESRTVQSVTDNASGTSTITLASVLTAAPGAGVLIVEQKTVTVDVTAGTITAVGTDITVDKNLTATSDTDPTETVTSTDIEDTYTSGVATLTKYVRNVTSASGTGTPLTYNGSDYYQAGVDGAPGDILEYLLVANNSGTGAVSASAITDVLPTEFVIFKSDVYSGNTEVAYDDGTAVSYLTEATGDDAASYDGSTGTLTIYIGSGATSAAGGSLAAGQSVYALYQASIKP